MGSCGAGPSYFVFSKRIFPRQVGNRRSNRKYPIGRVVRSLSAVREKMMERSLLQRIEAFLKESARSEEHTSELQSLMRISYAVFCLKKKTKQLYHLYIHTSQQ